MSKLDEICTAKKEHISAMKAQKSINQLEQEIKLQTPGRGFRYALTKSGKISLIAEVKKASPSKGIIRGNFNPVEIAKTYESAGATCLSVLTDEPYFQGKDEYLIQVKSEVTLPVLRKDFMIDPYQIFESRALGADCVLLILAALSDEQAKELYGLARTLTMDVLIETHDAQEIERAITLGADMIGINNRNLKTLEVDIKTAFDLADMIPDAALKIAESGIHSHDEVQALQDAGFNAILVGESLMREDDIESTVHSLMGINQS